MKIKSLVVKLLVLAVLLSACGAQAPFEVGSILFCPKNFEPGVSVCTVKETATAVNPDINNIQEYEAVKLLSEEVGIYKRTNEVYDIYRGVGYFPTPKIYVHVYPSNQQMLVSDIDPNACGGAHNDINCVKPLGNVTLMGVNQKFSSSYVLNYVFNFSQENLRLFYEVGGRDSLMKLFNDRSRDTFRNSRDIDPAQYISGEIGTLDVAKNWLNKLTTSEYMTEWTYFKLFTFKDLSVRYFEPEVKEGSNSTGSSQVLEDQAFTDFLAKKDLFCAQYTPGTSLRAECDRTFVCSQDGVSCYFGGAIIPANEITPTSVPEVTPAIP